MLPWVYDPDSETTDERKDTTEGAQREGASHDYNPEAYLAEYYQNYEQEQKGLYELQLEALRQRNQRRGADVSTRRSTSRSLSRSPRRRRSTSRSRSRSRSRSNSRSRSRSRNRRSRSRSPIRSNRSRSRGRGGDRAEPAIPVNKLALVNLPQDVTRDTIAMILASTGFLPQDIRVVHKTDRGAPRSFGFIDFADVATAIKWMDATKGWLTLSDGRRVSVQYARGDPASGGRKTINDWNCANCSAQNYYKREACYKCDTEISQSREMERQGLHMVGVVPCDTLLVRSLPHGVSTAAIFEGLLQNTPISSIVQLQLSDSKEYAFIQMKTVDDATLLVNSSYKNIIKILQKEVILTYCRHPMSVLVKQQIDLSKEASVSRPGPAHPSSGPVSGAEVAQAAIMRQRQAATSQPPPSLISDTNSSSMASNPYPQAVPPSYNMPPPQQGSHAQPVRGVVGVTPTPRGVMPKYVSPNPLTFVLEPSTGYFLDPITNFYYDAKTSYYFNNDTREWTYWDPTYYTYFPVQPSTTATSTNLASQNCSVAQPVQSSSSSSFQDQQTGHTSSNTGTATQSEAKSNTEQVPKKSAAEIAKEMMKWAKKQEKQKLQFSMKPLAKPLETKSVFSQQAVGGSASNPEITLKMLEKAKNPLAHLSDDSDEEDNHLQNRHAVKRKHDEIPVPHPVKEEDLAEPPVRKRHIPSAQEQREVMERALIDESKKMCLLCKRAFPSVDVLRKHVEKSDLHKKNLEEKRVEWGKQYVASMMAGAKDDESPSLIPNFPSSSASSSKMVYRDRAKERRKQYGLDGGYGREDLGGEFVKSEETLRNESESASSRPLDNSNIGNKLLKSMGWKEGSGVGKHGQGIVNPIEAERRVEGAGLGVSGSRITHGVEASHKERVRATFYNRYHEMNQ